MIKLRRIRWAGHVAQKRGRRTDVEFRWESQKERDH
jgi:hypothetical protein